MTERPILFSAPMVRALLSGTKTQTRRVVKSIELRGGIKGVRVAPNTFCYLDYKIPGLGWCPYGGSPVVPLPQDRVEAASPYGRSGDQLWVKETFAPCTAPIRKGHFHYRADGAVGHRVSTNGGDIWWERSGFTMGLADHSALGVWLAQPSKWKPSIFMPRDASRITLDVTAVRVERLQEISERDAISEGITEADASENVETPFVSFSTRWRNYDTSDPTNTYCVTARESYRSLWESINGAGSWTANPWVWVVSFKRVTP